MRLNYLLLFCTLILVAPIGLRAEQRAGKFPKQWYKPDNSDKPIVHDLQISRDGRKLLVGWASAIRVFDRKAGSSILLDSGSGKAICYPMLAPDGKTIVGIRGADPDWELVFWDAATGKELGRKAMKRATANYWRPMLLGFDRGGAAWVVRPAGAVDLVAVPTGKVVRSIEVPFTAGAWGRLIMSPDGNWLALGGGTELAIRRTAADANWIVVERHAAAERSEDLPQPTTCPIPCGFSNDGKRLVTYDRKSEVVAIWDIGDKISKLASRRAKLTPWTHLSDLKFTPDGKRFAFVAFLRPQDRAATEICFWDSRTLDEIARISPSRGVDAFAFTANGRRLLFAQPNGALGERNAVMWK